MTEIVGDFSEANALNDGYYAAMIFYFGQDDIEKYDIVFWVYESASVVIYEFTNGIFNE